MLHISIQSYRIDDITPVSFSTYFISAHVKIRNDTTSFAMSNISGRIYRQGRSFADVTISDIYLENGDNSIYLKGLYSISPGVSLFSLLKTISHQDFTLFSVDAELVVTFPSGDIKAVSKQIVQLSDFWQKE